MFRTLVVYTLDTFVIHEQRLPLDTITEETKVYKNIREKILLTC